MVEQAGKWYMQAVEPIRGRVRFAGFALKLLGRKTAVAPVRPGAATPVGDDGRMLLPMRSLTPHTR